MSKEYKFWMVFCPREDRRPPKVIHRRKCDAVEEAKRLARKEQAHFFVLEAIESFEIERPPPPPVRQNTLVERPLSPPIMSI